MLRKDGRYTIFKIQHWAEPGKMYKEGRWTESALDHFLNKGGWNVWEGRYRNKLKYPYNVFSACGDCWQETGEHGTYNSDDAIEMLKILSRLHPDTKFRVARVEISQQTVGTFYYQPEDITYADL